MPYCPRCGVEADPSVTACPLCSTPLPVFPDQGPGEPAWPPLGHQPARDPAKTYPTGSQRRLRAFWVVAAVLATAALANLASDLVTTGALTWSRYPLVSLTYGLGILGTLLAWYHRPWVWGSCWAVLTVALLGALDLASGRLSWSLGLGLPLAALTFGLVFLAVALLAAAKRRGYNLFGLVALLVAAELVGIDALVTHFTFNRWALGWSLVTTLVFLPLAFFFYFLHHALHRTPDLRRTFHF